MKIRIYQVNMVRDKDRVCFMSTDMLQKLRGSTDINAQIYDKVFAGTVEASNLEGVFRIFNVNHPAGYIGRSMSVSDVVEVVADNGEEPQFFFCDSFGFTKITFDAAKAVDVIGEKKTLRVVIVEPGKAAREAEIVADLSSLQDAVGGYIERFCPFADTACIICNEDGKFTGLLPNRAIRDTDGTIMDVIFGTFFICAAGSEDFISLTPAQIKKYKEMFKRPERIISSGGRIIVVPYDAPEDGEGGGK